MAETTESKPKWYALTVEAAAKQLQVDPAKGLSASEAKERLQKYGPNELGGKEEGIGLAGFPAPVPGFHADHPAGRCRT